MIFWGTGHDHPSFGVVIDVGSASVGIAIVAATETGTPAVVWTKRELAPLTDKVTHADAFAGVLKALKTAIQECGTTGTRALTAQYPHGRIEAINVTVAAPWGHTVMQSAALSCDDPIKITEDVLANVTEKAVTQARDKLKEHEDVEAHLTVLNTDVSAVYENGYRISDPIGTTAREVSATLMVELAHRKLHDTLTEQIERAFPYVEPTIRTFMHQFRTSLQSMHIDTTAAVLIDVTAEATEVGLVHDGLLTEVSYTPYGIHSLAREIADVCELPLGEALAYIRNEDDVLQTKQTKKLDDILALYQTNIVELFERVGGRLSVAKTVVLHTDARTESFFTKHIGAALKQLAGRTVQIQPITTRYFTDSLTDDSALLLSIHAFSAD